MALARLLAHALTCGCVPAHARGPVHAGAQSPFGSDWDYRAPETPPGERTPLLPSASHQSLRSEPSQLTLPPPIELPASLRYRTSQVTMYLKHSASRLFSGSPPRA